MRETNTHIYFFGKDDPFSNFHYSPFKYTYRTENFFDINDYEKTLNHSEIAYVFEKCRFYGFHDKAEECLKCNDPKVAKSISQSLPNTRKKDWYNRSYEVMYKVCYYKFTTNEDMKNILLNTGNKILVEASPYDTIWGVGISKENDDILQKENWLGENRLGKILMKVRKNIRSK